MNDGMVTIKGCLMAIRSIISSSLISMFVLFVGDLLLLTPPYVSLDPIESDDNSASICSCVIEVGELVGACSFVNLVDKLVIVHLLDSFSSINVSASILMPPR